MKAPLLVSAPTPSKRSSLLPAPARSVTPSCAGLEAARGSEDRGSAYVATKGFDFAKVPIHSPVTPVSSRSADIQAKLSISSPGDAAEQEADQIADQVMRMPTAGDAPPVGNFACINLAPTQRKATVSSPSHASEKEADHVATETARPAPSSQQSSIRSTPASTVRLPINLDTTTAVDAAQRGGTPMPKDQLSYFQPRFGHDFSQVRIHTDSSAAAGARVVQARAYTAGRDIVFGAGQYAPHTAAGRHLLAHELTHVVQQQRAPGPPNVLMRAPDPTPTSLDQFSETDRQSLQFDTDALSSPLILKQFFGLKGTVVAATNLDADIDIEVPAIEALKDAKVKSDLYSGLRQVALSVFDLLPGSDGKAHSKRLHLVHIESLDLTRFGGPKGSFRFTCLGNEAAGKITAKILVEAVPSPAKGMSDPGAVKDIEKRKVAPYGLKRGSSITDDALWQKVERSLGTVDEALIMRIRDVTFETSPKQIGADGEAASFDFSFKTSDTGPWKKTITLFQKIVTAQDDDFARLLDHELGHAIDMAPAEKPGGRIARGEAHNLPKFLEAAKKDGGRAKAITEYGKTSDKEFYAENLSLFIQQPETFQALRPNLYNYFVAYEWEAVRDPKFNASSTVWSTAPKAKP
jgi:hypothetical protein